MLSAGSDQGTLGKTALLVKPREEECVGVRMDNERRVTSRLGKISGRPERLDRVAEIVEQLTPTRPAGASNGIAQLGPSAGGGQPHAVEMLSSEPLDFQPGDALGIEAIELLGQQPHRLQPLDRQGPLDQAQQRFAANPPHRAVALRTEDPHKALLLGIVSQEHQRRGPTALPTFP